MELWIRSQDRERLFKIDKLGIEEAEGFLVVLYTDKYEWYRLGNYKTKERALEVLDEIQNILQPKYLLDSSSIKSNGDSWVENGIIMQNYSACATLEEIPLYVYEMPKE